MRVRRVICYHFIIRAIYLIDSEPFNNIIGVPSPRRRVVALLKMLILHAFWTV